MISRDASFDPKLLASLAQSPIGTALIRDLKSLRADELDKIAGAGNWDTARLGQGRVAMLDDLIKALAPPTQGNTR